MNVPPQFTAGLNANQIALLWVALVGIAFFAVGIYVVSGRWAADRPKRDAKALARWESARRLGFWRFALRSGSLPSCILFFYGRDLLRSWMITRTWEISRDAAIEAGVFATVVGVLV